MQKQLSIGASKLLEAHNNGTRIYVWEEEGKYWGRVEGGARISITSDDYRQLRNILLLPPSPTTWVKNRGGEIAPANINSALTPAGDDLVKAVLSLAEQHGYGNLTYEIPGKPPIRGVSVDGARLLHQIMATHGKATILEFDPVKDVVYATHYDSPSIPPGWVFCYLTARHYAISGENKIFAGQITTLGKAWAGIRNETREQFYQRTGSAFSAAFAKAKRNALLETVIPGVKIAWFEHLRSIAESRGERFAPPGAEEDAEIEKFPAEEDEEIG